MKIENFILKFNHKGERYIVDVSQFHPKRSLYPQFRAIVSDKVYVYYESEEKELGWYELSNYERQSLAMAIARHITWFKYNK
jgi:hypothetical protein